MSGRPSSIIDTGSSICTQQPFVDDSSICCQGKLTIPRMCEDMSFSARDLTDEGEIGSGMFGNVHCMVHTPSGARMAVKRIRCVLNRSERTETLKDLKIIMQSSNCPHIVQFYGALFEDGDCWICMEFMDTSLDKFSRLVYHHLDSRIPEPVLAKIALATIIALQYLKVELHVIHRDVKPSNILIDRVGRIRLCDFGISGQLIDSIAKSHDVGCRPYMAPERIDPNLCKNGYDIRSDVWSFGLTMIELATGTFPYPTWNSVFDQLACVLQGDPPSLPDRLPVSCPSRGSIDFSHEFRDFVSQCLQKDVHMRPKYESLLNHPVLQSAANCNDVDIGQYFCSVLDQAPAYF